MPTRAHRVLGNNRLPDNGLSGRAHGVSGSGHHLSQDRNILSSGVDEMSRLPHGVHPGGDPVSDPSHDLSSRRDDVLSGGPDAVSAEAHGLSESLSHGVSNQPDGVHIGPDCLLRYVAAYAVYHHTHTVFHRHVGCYHLSKGAHGLPTSQRRFGYPVSGQ